MTVSFDCPNCGASVRPSEVGDSSRCTFCGTHLALPHPRRGLSRKELETEREQILVREREWEAKIQQATKRGIDDVLVPPIGCCGIYFGLFVVGSLILSALGLKASQRYGTVVAVIAISSALIGVVLIIWRREARRRERVVALERERMADRGLREERLREIEADLHAMDGGYSG